MAIEHLISSTVSSQARHFYGSGAWFLGLRLALPNRSTGASHSCYMPNLARVRMQVKHFKTVFRYAKHAAAQQYRSVCIH